MASLQLKYSVLSLDNMISMCAVPDEGLLPLLLLLAEWRGLLAGFLLQRGPLNRLHGADDVGLGHDGLCIQRLVLMQRTQAFPCHVKVIR
jgi:hypothetical protein